MKHLLHDRLVQILIGSVLLCILAFAGYTAYDRWSYVRRAYAEAAQFGYTEDNFLVSEEHCGGAGYLPFFIRPVPCYLTIYFTTDMTRDQLVQFFINKLYFRKNPRNGSPVSPETIIGDINQYGGKRITISGAAGSASALPGPDIEQWGFVDRNFLSVTYWRIDPNLTYAIDGKPIRKNIIGVGVRP